MGVFDQASRFAVKRAPEAFFAWRAPRLLDHFTFQGWADTTTLAFPGEPDRICDTVALFAPRAAAGVRLLLDVESQSEPDPDMLERLGEYAYRLGRELRHDKGQAGKYRVASLLLNLTGPGQPAELDMREEGLEGAGFHAAVPVVTFSAESAADTLARVAAGELPRAVLPWIPLMSGGGEEGIIQGWKRLALPEPDERSRADYGGLALVFAELANRRDAWRKGLEGWNVQVSQQVLEWQAQAREEGEVRRARAYLLRVLEANCKAPVPAGLKATIEGMSDLGELDRWFQAALHVNTYEAFQAAVAQPTAPTNGA